MSCPSRHKIVRGAQTHLKSFSPVPFLVADLRIRDTGPEWGGLHAKGFIGAEIADTRRHHSMAKGKMIIVIFMGKIDKAMYIMV